MAISSVLTPKLEIQIFSKINAYKKMELSKKS